MSVKDLREELRNLRKELLKPVSKMGKRDISEEIQSHRVKREETPPVASTTGGSLKQTKKAVESVKEAKKTEFPVEVVEKKEKKVSIKEPKVEKVEKAKRVITPEHLAKMKAGKLAKKQSAK